MYKFAILALASVLLAGCSRSTAPGEITLAVVPADLEDCGHATSPSSITIHWDASEALPQGGTIKLWITNKPADQGIFGGGTNGTLWTHSGTKGTATTGPWMKPGTRITMTDAANDDVLARLDVPAAPCE